MVGKGAPFAKLAVLRPEWPTALPTPAGKVLGALGNLCRLHQGALAGLPGANDQLPAHWATGEFFMRIHDSSIPLKSIDWVIYALLNVQISEQDLTKESA